MNKGERRGKVREIRREERGKAGRELRVDLPPALTRLESRWKMGRLSTAHGVERRALTREVLVNTCQ